jgi:hypothetical protein
MQSFSFGKVHIESQPLPVDLANHTLDFVLADGLPSIDHFQLDVMGGTVRGSLFLSREDSEIDLSGSILFSGLNAQHLVPDDFGSIPESDAEVSGHAAFSLPLSGDMEHTLQNMELQVDLTHIGRLALERFLFALDPSESNESIVAQRRLVSTGSPTWFRIGVKNGNLSMAGQAAVKGVAVDIPLIERLNIANLPGLEAYGEKTAPLDPVLRALLFLSSDTVGIDREGRIGLYYRGERQP